MTISYVQIQPTPIPYNVLAEQHRKARLRQAIEEFLTEACSTAARERACPRCRRPTQQVHATLAFAGATSSGRSLGQRALAAASPPFTRRTRRKGLRSDGRKLFSRSHGKLVRLMQRVVLADSRFGVTWHVAGNAR